MNEASGLWGVLCLVGAPVLVSMAAWGVRDRSVKLGSRRFKLGPFARTAWAVGMLGAATGLGAIGLALLTD